jgi:3-hydroxybutyryl-CoA dehydrogenase
VPRIGPEDDVGVLGAGTMGAGIAEVAARTGHPVRIYDAADGAAERGLVELRRRLDRDAAAGRLSAAEAEAAGGRVHPVRTLEELSGCRVVVEAVVEDLGVKCGVLRAVEGVLDADALLATNTSTLSVTALGSALDRPGRLVGMHFFNPAPRMALVEVIHGAATDPGTTEAAADLARAWGKTPVICDSTPGFVVNRVARPFHGEAQRLLERAVADPATIDAVLREAGGFPIGPLALADLIGQDVNLAVSRTVWEQTFHDPRYAPTAYQQRLVDAGRLGRKTGQGVYRYADRRALDDAPRTEPKRLPPQRVELVEDDFGPMAAFLDRIDAAGVAVVRVPEASRTEDGPVPAGLHLPGGGLLRVTDGAPAHSWLDQAPAGVVILDWARDPATCTRVALMPSRGCAPAVLESAIGLCQAAGAEVSVLADVAGGIVARTIAMLVNEAVDVVARKEASAADVDVAMRLGLGHPSGPLEWGDRLQAWRIAAVLAHLHEETPTGRYRASPRLKEAVAGGEKLRDL